MIISFITIILILIIIGLETFINNKSKLYSLLILLFKILVMLFEYAVLFWFWFGDGVYMLIAIPACFTILILLYSLLIKKYAESNVIKKLLINSKLLITPILCILITYILAKIIGITVNIQ